MVEPLRRPGEDVKGRYGAVSWDGVEGEDDRTVLRGLLESVSVKSTRQLSLPVPFAAGSYSSHSEAKN